jgi:hypothetical protein
MEHLLNLTACHIIDKVSPTTVSTIKKKIAEDSEKSVSAPNHRNTSDSDEEEEVDDDDELLSDIDGDASNDELLDLDEDPKLLADMLGKALAFTEKVCVQIVTFSAD